MKEEQSVAASKHRAAFNASARRVAADDFWAQVQRTVNGRVVDESQIAMIVDAIAAGVDLQPNDCVIDLCCGNGALSDRTFERCGGGLGIDFADELIAIAKRYFERLPERAYRCADVAAYVAETSDTARFTKAVCYGSIQLLSPDNATAVLRHIRQRFPAVRAFFLGNLPDRDRLTAFYEGRDYRIGIEDDYESAIGLWRTEEQITSLAAATGWYARIVRMPQTFYAAHYRYDVILEPRATA